MFFELVKNVLKIGLIALLAWWTIGGLMGKLAGTAVLALPEIVAVGKSGFMVLMAQAAGLHHPAGADRLDLAEAPARGKHQDEQARDQAGEQGARG